jgi:hypothetical protein
MAFEKAGSSKCLNAPVAVHGSQPCAKKLRGVVPAHFPIEIRTLALHWKSKNVKSKKRQAMLVLEFLSKKGSATQRSIRF